MRLWAFEHGVVGMEQRHTKHINKETNQCLKDVVTNLIQMIKYR